MYFDGLVVRPWQDCLKTLFDFLTSSFSPHFELKLRLKTCFKGVWAWGSWLNQCSSIKSIQSVQVSRVPHYVAHVSSVSEGSFGVRKRAVANRVVESTAALSFEHAGVVLQICVLRTEVGAERTLVWCKAGGRDVICVVESPVANSGGDGVKTDALGVRFDFIVENRKSETWLAVLPVFLHVFHSLVMYVSPSKHRFFFLREHL